MKKVILILSLVSLVIITGCLKPGTSIEEKFKVSVYITDAVIPISYVTSLEIEINRILLMSENGSLVISDEPITVDLIDLIGDTYEIASVEASGIYCQLRFEVGDATVTINLDGEERIYPVTVVSSSIKYDFREHLVIEGNTEIVLDFDLSRSLKINGKWPDALENPNPTIIMTPAIHERHGALYNIHGFVKDTEGNGVSRALLVMKNDENDTILTTFSHHTHHENGGGHGGGGHGGSHEHGNKHGQKWEEGEFKFPKVEEGYYTIYVYKEETYESVMENLSEMDEFLDALLGIEPDGSTTINVTKDIYDLVITVR